jgi:hypothetical protein
MGEILMIERLGNVLYWLGCGLAVLLAGLAILMAWNAPEPVLAAIFFGVPAVVSWLIGCASLYILAGR